MDSRELRSLIAQFGGGAKIIVVSNREPWVHERIAGELKAVRPASGMVVGLEPVVRAAEGVWIAHGSGSADRQVALKRLSSSSRTIINDALDDMVDEINWRHQTEEWYPIHFQRAHYDYLAVLAGYRMADVLIVTSLHDGMNLVAKEFIASRTDGDGMMVLSKYTGCARELNDALLVNPFDVDQLADVFYEAYRMPGAERRQHMARMREKVEKHNVFDWAAQILGEACKCLKLESLPT